MKAYLYKTARNMNLRRMHKWKIHFSLEALEEEPESETLVEEVIRRRNNGVFTFLHGAVKVRLPGGFCILSTLRV